MLALYNSISLLFLTDNLTPKKTQLTNHHVHVKKSQMSTF